MNRLISCEFNMDTTCVELKFADSSVIAIDTIAVENEVADNMYQRSELDYLIYNDPFCPTLVCWKPPRATAQTRLSRSSKSSSAS